jgi:hypothetical protein
MLSMDQCGCRFQMACDRDAGPSPSPTPKRRRLSPDLVHAAATEQQLPAYTLAPGGARSARFGHPSTWAHAHQVARHDVAPAGKHP